MLQKSENRVRNSAEKNFIIHPIFLIFAIFLCVFWNAFYVLSFLLTILLHEYAHFLVAKSKGVVLNNFKLMPYGAQLSLKDCILDFKDDILIALAGPLVNLIFGIIGIGLWWIFPEIYAYTEVFVYSNFSLAFFNLLPILPLDGSRVVLAVASKYGKRLKMFKLLRYVNIFLAFILFVLFLISLFILPNFSLGIISFFILFTAFEDEDKYVYESLIFSSNLNLRKNKSLPLKLYCIDAESDASCLFKLLNPNYYVGIIIIKNNKIKKVLMQNEFSKFIESGGKK